MDDVRAIGRIRAGGPWAGFVQRADGYHLVVGDGPSTRERAADRDLLLALAVSYFEEAFDDPPPELEASHADLSALVREVAASERDPRRSRLLGEAIDAIDDGLAGDAVANRLNAAREPAPHTDEQADPVDLLVTLVEEMLRD
jgi:hypothetical protein